MRSTQTYRSRPVIIPADSRARSPYTVSTRPFVQGELGPGKFLLTLICFGLMV